MVQCSVELLRTLWHHHDWLVRLSDRCISRLLHDHRLGSHRLLLAYHRALLLHANHLLLLLHLHLLLLLALVMRLVVPLHGLLAVRLLGIDILIVSQHESLHARWRSIRTVLHEHRCVISSSFDHKVLILSLSLRKVLLNSFSG